MCKAKSDYKYKQTVSYNAKIILPFIDIGYLFNHGTQSYKGDRTSQHINSCKIVNIKYEVLDENEDRFIKDGKKIIDPREDSNFVKQVMLYINEHFLKDSVEKVMTLTEYKESLLSLMSSSFYQSIYNIITDAKLSETECIYIPACITDEQLEEAKKYVEDNWYKTKAKTIKAKLSAKYSKLTANEKKMAAKPIASDLYKYFLKEANLDKNTNYNIISVQSILLAFMIYSFDYKYNKLKIIITADDKEKNEIQYNIMKKRNNIEMVECETDLEVEEEYTDMIKQKSFYNGKNRILMNPPFDGNLHLQITESVLNIRKINPDTEIVSISPARWLEDPLGQYKQNTDIKKFKESVYNKISNLQLIDASSACKAFDIMNNTDLAIYTFNDKKTAIVITKYSDLINKLYNKIKTGIVLADKAEKDAINGFRCEVKELASGTGGHNMGDYDSSKIADVNIVWGPYSDGYDKIGNFFTDTRQKNQYTKSYFAYSIKFDTLEEANNFYLSCNTKFYRRIVHLFKWNQIAPLRFLPYMDDYSHVWSDEDYCKYFDLIPEELEFMCKAVDDYRIKDFIDYINLDED